MVFTEEDRRAGAPEQEEERAQRSGKAADERWHRRKDGSTFWGSGYLFRLAGLSSYVKIVRDITDRKRLEERILCMNEELERRVMERTEQLERATQRLESFCFTVAHDLRAPLRQMSGLAQLVLEDCLPALPDSAVQNLRKVQNSAERMDRLIHDLLEHSRMSRSELQVEPANLSEVVERALGQLESEIRGRQAEISVVEPLPTVQADPVVLGRVVTNLLSNALKFTHPGAKPEIRICAHEFDHSVRLWVEDKGIGIRTEHHGRIFGMFERLHGGESYAGTGVGLAIVAGAVNQMGGKVGVESEEGRGSRFWIELPKPCDTQGH